jgi:hypothetical protein
MIDPSSRPPRFPWLSARPEYYHVQMITRAAMALRKTLRIPPVM